MSYWLYEVLLFEVVGEKYVVRLKTRPKEMKCL